MNFFSNTRKLGLICLISGLSALTLQTALAQTATGGASAMGAAAPSLGLTGGFFAAGQAGTAPGTADPGGLTAQGAGTPTTTPRPDFGATDAQRGNLTPLKAAKTQVPSQFQRFVLEGTGILLPHFGASLFENPGAYAADSAAPAPSEYVLGPGDEVRIQIWGTVDFAGNQTLDRNGQISLPKIGAIALGGVQVKDLESVLKKQVATVYNNFSINVTLGKLRGITVYVVGQANQPGTYNLNSLSTLVNAVFASGGPSTIGSMRQIELKRGGRTITTLDLYDFIVKGDKSKDAALQPGDVIMIPPAGPRMALVGATDHGAIYELKPTSKVKDVLGLGGGLSSLASQQKALLERIATNANPTQKAAREVQHITLNAQGLDQGLQDGDVLTLLPISPAFANAVTLQGTVSQQSRHPWMSNMRISDLIPDREALITPDYYKRKNKLVQSIYPKDARDPRDPRDAREFLSETLEVGKLKDTKYVGKEVAQRIYSMLDQINWDYALVERLNTKDLRIELIPFNLGKAVLQKDPAHNLVLQPGDVVTILSSTDVQLPAERKTRLVRIEGEVAAPGVYQVKPGETLLQLLQRVGGLTPQAYLYGIEFTRESVRKQQQENLEELIRRLEAQSANAGATLAANLTADRAAQAATLQQQQQQQQQQQMQAQIARLRAMKSKGRVSLELDPDKQNLPNLPLEDGDTILVPTLPAFVSAVGRVNNENVFIFKQGKTVGDLITTAGVNEDSELSQAFVLRADGSIFSRKAAGWFTSFESAKLMPGDTVVVPFKVDRESNYNLIMRGLRDWTQIFSNLGIGAAAIRTLRN